MLETNNEAWRDIRGYEGLYQISNHGQIKSLARIDPNNHRVKERILNPVDNGNGYLYVVLYKNKKRKNLYVHRLVAEAFIGKCPEGLVVNHIDECKTNNHINNLEYVTPKQNSNHGTCIDRVTKANRNHPNMSIPVESYSLTTGKTIKRYASMREAEREDGYYSSSVSECVRGQRKSHYGVGFRRQL